MDQQAGKNKTERVTGLGRRTREDIAKCNQMTALRFQTGGRQISSPPFEGELFEKHEQITKTIILPESADKSKLGYSA